MYQHLWYQLKVTIKGFNVDAYYCIPVKYENVQHSAKFVFYPSIWTIYNVF